MKHHQYYGENTEHGVGGEGGRVPSPGVSTATWAFWAQGGYPARLLDPSLVEALCPAPVTEPTATPRCDRAVVSPLGDEDLRAPVQTLTPVRVCPRRC